MIAPQELRIGNHLNAVVSNGVETLNFYELIVNEIKADGIREEKGLIFPYENLVGAPLTEDWLIKFGFGVDIEFDHHFIDNTSRKNEVIRYSTDSKLFTIEGILGDVIEITLQYVHQLQNLYFALTGEELTIKE